MANGEPPTSWELQRSLSRLEERHDRDRGEMYAAVESLGCRLELAIAAIPHSIPLTTWEERNRHTDAELAHIRAEIAQIRAVDLAHRRLNVTALLVMLIVAASGATITFFFS